MASQNITNTQKIGVSNNEKSDDSSVLEDSFDSEVQRKYGGEEDSSNENSSELCDSYDSEVQEHFKEEKPTGKNSKVVKKQKKKKSEKKVVAASEHPQIKNLFLSLQNQSSLSNSS